jgi:hypothetical protein
MEYINRRVALTLGLAAAPGLVFGASTAEALYEPDLGEEIAPGVRQVFLGSAASNLSGYTRISMRDLVFQPGSNTYDPSIQNDMISYVAEGVLIVRQGGTQWIAKSSYGPWTSTKGTKTAYMQKHSEVTVLRIIDLFPR